MILRGFIVLLAMAAFTLASATCADAAEAAKPKKPWEPEFEIYEKWPFDAKEARRRQAETARTLRVPVEKTIMLPGNVPMQFILIPAGEFVMGTPETEPMRHGEEKLHRVQITLPYYIGKYEFLQREWVAGASQDKKLAINRSHHGHHGHNRPVDTASWRDTQRVLWQMNQLKIGVFTLPTEAEWEVACRAGSTTPFHFGEAISHHDANYDGSHVYGNGKKSGSLWRTTDVGQYPPNAFGLYDMHGNVAEWVWDIYDLYAYINREKKKAVTVYPAGPGGRKDYAKHVYRGGGYGLTHPAYIRSAARSSEGAKMKRRNRGFRAVLRTLRFPKAKPEPKPKPKPKPTLEGVKPAVAKAGHTIYAKWPFDAKEAKRRQAETAKALKIPVEKTIDLGNGVKIELVLVPAGWFMMGSPAAEPSHSRSEEQRVVKIDKPFYVAKYEMTHAQYAHVMGKEQSKPKDQGEPPNDPKLPAAQMPYFDCTKLIGKLNALVKKKGAFALPTEAQWEYACRAGTATAFHFGATISADQANLDGGVPYAGGAKSVNGNKPMPVGSFKPNAFGLYDMHGNVFEWCNEWYNEDGNVKRKALKPPDPARARSQIRRVMKGGSWYDFARHSRSAYSYAQDPSKGSEYIGVRVIYQALE